MPRVRSLDLNTRMEKFIEGLHSDNPDFTLVTGTEVCDYLKTSGKSDKNLRFRETLESNVRALSHHSPGGRNLRDFFTRAMQEEGSHAQLSFCVADIVDAAINAYVKEGKKKKSFLMEDNLVSFLDLLKSKGLPATAYKPFLNEFTFINNFLNNLAKNETVNSEFCFLLRQVADRAKDSINALPQESFQRPRMLMKLNSLPLNFTCNDGVFPTFASHSNGSNSSEDWISVSPFSESSWTNRSVQTTLDTSMGSERNFDITLSLALGSTAHGIVYGASRGIGMWLEEKIIQRLGECLRRLPGYRYAGESFTRFFIRTFLAGTLESFVQALYPLMVNMLSNANPNNEEELDQLIDRMLSLYVSTWGTRAVLAAFQEVPIDRYVGYFKVPAWLRWSVQSVPAFSALWATLSQTPATIVQSGTAFASSLLAYWGMEKLSRFTHTLPQTALDSEELSRNNGEDIVLDPMSRRGSQDSNLSRRSTKETIYIENEEEAASVSQEADAISLTPSTTSKTPLVEEEENKSLYFVDKTLLSKNFDLIIGAALNLENKLKLLNSPVLLARSKKVLYQKYLEELSIHIGKEEDLNSLRGCKKEFDFPDFVTLYQNFGPDLSFMDSAYSQEERARIEKRSWEEARQKCSEAFQKHPKRTNFLTLVQFVLKLITSTDATANFKSWTIKLQGAIPEAAKEAKDLEHTLGPLVTQLTRISTVASELIKSSNQSNNGSNLTQTSENCRENFSTLNNHGNRVQAEERLILNSVGQQGAFFGRITEKIKTASHHVKEVTSSPTVAVG